MAATVDAVAIPETINSRMSTICVAAPPFSAMKFDVPAATPCADAVNVNEPVVKRRFAIVIPF
jgi:hypothetical protein